MNVKRKILFVNSSVSGGGAGKALVYLLRALQKDVIEPVVALPSNGLIGADILKMGIKVIYIPWLPERFGKTQIPLPKMLRFKWLQITLNILLMHYFAVRIAILAKKENVDLICSNHQYHMPHCVVGGWLAKVPVVLLIREYPEGWWPRFYCRTFAKTKTVQRIFAVSKVSAELYRDLEKLVLLHDSYDFEDFGNNMPQPSFKRIYDIPHDKFIFGFVGRIIERKGVDFLIRAFASVHKRYPQTHLAVVGGNDLGISYDLIQQYKDLTRELGIEKHVTFTGFQKDVRAMTCDFDVCVMPSLNPEPFGLVYLESVICKVPCIVPDNSGAAEVIVNGKNGKLFKAKNLVSLEEAMCDSYIQQERLKPMTEYAYQNIKPLFDTYEQSQNISGTFLAATVEREG